MQSWKGSARLIVPFFVITTWITGIFAFGLLPQDVASHWDINGRVDGFLPRVWGAFLIPVVVSVLAVFLALAPKIDPKSHNFAYFRSGYSIFSIALLGFMYYVYLLTLLWNFGVPFSMPKMLMFAFGILFWLIGDVLVMVRQNWFIGIKTPWTLSSERVWNETHVVGRKCFYGLAIASFVSVWLPAAVGFVAVVVGSLVVSVWLFWYSWRRFTFHSSH